MRKLLCTTAAAIFTVCGASPALAAAPPQASSQASVTTAPNGTRVNLSGKIVSTSPDSFQLDIGKDVIRVEMDDWDWFKEGNSLKVGDEVFVSGNVDKDLWEQLKIEARSVFVRNLGITFYASGADDEDLIAPYIRVNPVSSTMGVVTAVEGPELTVGSAAGPVRVDMSQLKIRPALKVGDRVHAWGDIDVDRRERVELMADGVVVLTVDRTKRL